MKFRKSLFLFILLIATSIFGEQAQEGFYLKLTVPGRINPLGSGLYAITYYRIPMIREAGRLWESTHIDIGVSNNLSPAFETVQGYLNIEPIAIFDVTFMAGYFWTFNALDYGIPRLPLSDAPIDYASLDGYHRGEADGGFGWKVVPRLKLALGPVIISHSFTWNSFDFSTVESEYMYDVTLDVRMKKADVVMENSSYVLYKFSESFMAGLNFYHVFVPGTTYESYRLAAMGAYNQKFNDRLDFLAALLAGPYFKHENYPVFLALQLSLTMRL